MRRRLATALALLTTACVEEVGDDDRDASGPASVLQPEDLDRPFAAAADEFDVPVELLEGIAWAETRWHMVHGSEEGHPHGPEPAFGVMALRGDRLVDGAALAGVSLEHAQSDPEGNIRAAAAWLSARASVLGVDPRDEIGAWTDVVADYSGLENPDARAVYVDHDVLGALRTGFVAETEDGRPQGSLPPVPDLPPRFAAPLQPLGAAGPDYADAIWRPSPNFSSRPAGTSGDVQMVIVHSCEGSYAGCWSWLTDTASGVSSHYVVDATGSEISQLVTEADKAWHIGASYDCSLNDSTNCGLNGFSSNGFTVGVEHAGFASQTSWDEGLLDASAQLVCDITEEYGIPRDANHIVAHAQLQPANRTDPGAGWPWEDYITKVKLACGDYVFSEIVVDNDDANNDPALADAQHSGNWIGSSYTAGYWETGYRYASTQAISDAFTFWFYLGEGGVHPIDAWWTAGSNRSPAAPFLVYNASGTQLGSVFVDQSFDGNQWNELGTYAFTAGWNRVVLSRWATSGFVVMADAIRVRE